MEKSGERNQPVVGERPTIVFAQIGNGFVINDSNYAGVSPNHHEQKLQMDEVAGRAFGEG
jgi:hypothetical protein